MMDLKLWTCREFGDKEVVYKNMGIRKWKWVLHLHISWLVVGLHWDNYMKCRESVDWHLNHAHFHYEFRPFHWGWNSDSMYYDGNWCSKSYGPFWVMWWD